MVETCELEVPRRELLECPTCTDIFFDRIGQVQIGQITVIVIRRYQLQKCFLGLAVGQHVHSLTLLPTEELEIEIVRRSKFSRALHEQRSVESEFRFELQSTSRDEWSSEEEVNWKVGGGVDFEIFGIGVKSSGEYNSREKTAEEHFREVITKTSTKVSRKYELSIDTKSEVENQYRSVRRISNPNECQPVMYHYYQLAKKYRTELILTDIRFDFRLRQLPPPTILREPFDEVVFRAQTPYRQNLNLQVVAPPPAWTLLREPGQTATSQFAGQSTAFSRLAALQSFAQPIGSQLGTVQSLAQPVTAQIINPAVSIAAAPPIRVPVEPADVRRLTKDELVESIREANPDLVDEFVGDLDEFLQEEINETGVHDSYEYCINTDGLYVDTTLSKCSACDEVTLELRRLEVEKAKMELEMMKRKKKEDDDDNHGGGPR